MIPKAIRRAIKQFVPYCIESAYAARRYGFIEARDLEKPRTRAGKAARALRGLLPYGLVRGLWPDPPPDRKALTKAFAATCAHLAEKLRQRGEINAVFLVANAAMFPAKPLFEAMLRDGAFSPRIVVVPDLRWWGRDPRPAMERCAAELAVTVPLERLAIARKGADGEWLDVLAGADIVCYPSPYELSDYHYNPRYVVGRSFLPVMVNYGFYRSIYDRFIMRQRAYGYMWLALFECAETFEEYARSSPTRGANAEVTGYVKMDALEKASRPPRAEGGARRKCILVALHHSIARGQSENMHLANFARYARFFRELPAKHPDVDFIFRAHPYLRTVMERRDMWGKERTKEYFDALEKNPNATLSTGADYFADFARSDAIIQDCGSFLVEYLYTRKPCCYMLKSRSEREKLFAPLGQKCLDVCYLAYDSGQIERFITDVVLGGADPKAGEREKLAAKVMVNYPHAAETALWRILERIIGAQGERASVVDVLMATHSPNPEYLREQRESILRQRGVKVNLIEREDAVGEGACANFARLLELSTAPYVAFADQDDVWDDDKLARALELMHELENEWGKDAPLLVFSDATVVDEKLAEISSSLFEHTRIDPERILPRQIAFQNVPNGNTMLFNSALARLASPIPPEAFMHDHWIMLVASSFGHVAYLRESTLRYRQHGANVLGGAKVGARYFFERAMGGREALRKRIWAYIRQAEAFTERFGSRTPPALRALHGLDLHPWPVRAATILRHRIFKNGLARIIGTLLVV